MEALSLWKKVAGKGEDGISEGSKGQSYILFFSLIVSLYILLEPAV